MRVIIAIMLFAVPLLAQDSLLVVGDGLSIFLPDGYTMDSTRTAGKVNVNGTMIRRNSAGVITDTIPRGYDPRTLGTREPVRLCPVRTVTVTFKERAELRGIDLWLDLDGLVPLTYERGSKLDGWISAMNLSDGAKFSTAVAQAVSFEAGDTLVVISAVGVDSPSTRIDKANGDEKDISGILNITID